MDYADSTGVPAVSHKLATGLRGWLAPGLCLPGRTPETVVPVHQEALDALVPLTSVTVCEGGAGVCSP